MFKALVKTRLAALWASFYARGRNAKGGKKPSKIGGIGIAILLIYAAIVFAGMFSAMFFGIAELYHALGIGWLYFALAGILAAGVCLWARYSLRRRSFITRGIMKCCSPCPYRARQYWAAA